MKNTVIALAATSLLAACATAPSTQELASADYGGPVTQAAAIGQAANFMAGYLIDPYSSQSSCNQVHPGYFQGSRLSGGAVAYGWTINCLVNAKNRFGGYTGVKHYNFLFRDGVLTQVQGERDLGQGVTMLERLK